MGLDLIDRVPDELQTEVPNIVQDTGIKIIRRKKKCKKVKWLTEEALETAVKRRKEKSKGEKERYSHFNVKFQRIARRDQKALLAYRVIITIWDDPERWYEEGGGRGVQDWEHVYTCGGYMLMYGKINTVL